MKKIAIIFVSLFVLSVSFVNASNDENGGAESAVMTTTVSGKVLDKITGEALAGVKVELGSESTTYTDFEGNFEVNNVKPGNIELVASYISYKNKVEVVNIDLQKSNSIEVQIESVTE